MSGPVAFPESDEGVLKETQVHPTAELHPSAELGVGVEVGPWTVVGPNVTVGDGARLDSQVLVERNTSIGSGCRIHKGAVLGTDPQDLKFDGEETFLQVGDGTTIREYATLNRGTSASGRTVVGAHCLLMAYTHVAHDCHLGDHVIISNATQMAGHVEVGDWVTISGLVAIHQFVRVGSYAFIGGCSRIAQDVPPYCRASGDPPKLYGLNSVGLERRGFTREQRSLLKQAYRQVFSASVPLTEGLAQAAEQVEASQEVLHFLDFIRSSPRGVTAG
ncbi:MAG: acyl-ACP--UDP-N-acetylglucosamine O-acyltransferase [Gemmatimonadota bacterium]